MLIKESLKKEIKELLRKDRLTEALDKLFIFFEDDVIQKEIILHSAQYIRLKNARRKNLIDWENANASKNKIISAILELLDSMEEDIKDILPIHKTNVVNFLTELDNNLSKNQELNKKRQKRKKRILIFSTSFISIILLIGIIATSIQNGEEIFFFEGRITTEKENIELGDIIIHIYEDDIGSLLIGTSHLDLNGVFSIPVKNKKVKLVKISDKDEEITRIQVPYWAGEKLIFEFPNRYYFSDSI